MKVNSKSIVKDSITSNETHFINMCRPLFNLIRAARIPRLDVGIHVSMFHFRTSLRKTFPMVFQGNLP